MSQSSSLLTEDEITVYLNETLGLKLDKELLKPTKDIYEIYVRLMDDIGCNWRKPTKSTSESDEPNLKILLARWIRLLIDRYNLGFSFQLSDLITPNRRRTTAFLNVLIYLREQVQEQFTIINEFAEEWETRKALAEKEMYELSQRRLELEDLALKKARSKESSNTNKEKREEFEKLQKEGELLAEEAKQIKDLIKAQAEKDQVKKQQLEICEKDLQHLDKTLLLLNEGRDMKKKKQELELAISSENEQIKACIDLIKKTKEITVAREKLITLKQLDNEKFAKEVDFALNIVSGEKKDRVCLENKLEHAQAANVRLLDLETELKNHSIFDAERTRTKKKLQYKIKEEQIKLELEKSKVETNELAQTYQKRIQELQENIAAIKKEQTKLSAKHSEESKLCLMYIENANKQLELLRKRFDQFEQLWQKTENLKIQ